jgi:hypothetical protein
MNRLASSLVLAGASVLAVGSSLEAYASAEALFNPAPLEHLIDSGHVLDLGGIALQGAPSERMLDRIGKSTVALTVNFDINSAGVMGYANNKIDEAGSGVVVTLGPRSQRLVITAGHMGLGHKEEGNRPSPLEYHCSNQYIEYQASPSDLGSVLQAVRGGGVESKYEDAAVLQVKPNAGFRQLPAAEIPATEHIQFGERVIFSDYEPTAGGLVRNPNNTGATYKNESLESTKPAMFGGRVLGINQNGAIMVLSAIGENYGRGVPDDSVRGGASGGGVFSAETGKLMGMSIASYKNLFSADDIYRQYGIRIIGAPDKRYQIEFVQPVDKSIIGSLLAHQHTCGYQMTP